MSDAVMVPRAWLEAFRRDTDPTEPIADNGGTVWDMFCHEAAAMLAASPSVGGWGSSADADTHRAADGAVVGWQDVETAPRDGRWLLLEGEMSGGDTSTVRVGRWNPTYSDATRCTYEWQCVDPYAIGSEGQIVDAFWNWYADGRVNGWMPLPPPPPVSTGSRPQEAVPSEQADRAVVAHMVQRFLSWRLPEDFNPDNGVSFKPTFNDHMEGGPMQCNPTGTNLFDARQAEAMVKHMLEGLPK